MDDFRACPASVRPGEGELAEHQWHTLQAGSHRPGTVGLVVPISSTRDCCIGDGLHLSQF